MTDVESPPAADSGLADSGLELTTAGFARAGFPGPGFAPDGATGGAALSDRLTALARITQIGSARSGHDGFDPELLRRVGRPAGPGGGAAAAVRRPHGGGPGRWHRQREVVAVQPAGQCRLLAGRGGPADDQGGVRLRLGDGGRGPAAGLARGGRAQQVCAVERARRRRELDGRAAAARPARPRLGAGGRDRLGEPAGIPGRPDGVGARSAEVRRRRRAQPLPGADGRPLVGHLAGAQPGRPAHAAGGARLRGGPAAPARNRRACTTARCWSPRRSPAPGSRNCGRS